MSSRALGTALVAAAALAAVPAAAHVVVGVRLFPVTLTFDDPGVADEATLPAIVTPPAGNGQRLGQLQWEYDKTITPTTALIYNQGYDALWQPGEKVRNGFENVFLTAKWQLYTDPEHESVVSLGVIRELGGNSATQAIGGDAYGSTAPSIYFGQGFGFMPIPALRPFAITGEGNYVIADHRLNSDGDNSGNPNAWLGGLSLQYSIPYLQSQVHDFGLPDFIGRLIPLVETTWYSPAERPAYGLPSTFTIAAGAIYMADAYQSGLELLIPGNKASGRHLGALWQLHFFFDDLFPNTIGKPLLP